MYDDEVDEFELANILRRDMAKDIEHGLWPRLEGEVLEPHPTEDPAGRNFYDVVLGSRVYRISVRDIGAALR